MVLLAPTDATKELIESQLESPVYGTKADPTVHDERGRAHEGESSAFGSDDGRAHLIGLLPEFRPAPPTEFAKVQFVVLLLGLAPFLDEWEFGKACEHVVTWSFGEICETGEVFPSPGTKFFDPSDRVLESSSLDVELCPPRNLFLAKREWREVD
jgi:hypothetical protein